MEKSLSVASAIESHRLSSDVPYLCLIDIEIVDPVTGVVAIVESIVRNPEPVIYRGTTYKAGTFDIQIKAEAGKVSEVTLTVNDFTQTIQGYMEAYGGGVGSNVTFRIINSAELTAAPDMEEFFQITAASSAGYVQSFTLGAENVLMQTFPRRRQTKDFCQWRYKSAECGYSGVLATCDLTLQGSNGCVAHANAPRFGAFPGLNGNGYRYS